MKSLGYLLIAACICLGTFAAATAYSPTLERARDLVQTRNAEFFLAQPAGVLPAEGADAPPPHGRVPVLAAGSPLTLENIDLLEQANGRIADPAHKALRVRIREFSFATWDLAWLFGVSVLGLIAGGVIVKMQTRREIAAHATAVEESSGSPHAAMRALTADLDRLAARAAAAATTDDRLDAIIAGIGDLQQTHIHTIVQSRTILVGRLGLAGFAQFMDRFSAVERKMNRAWSAAADRHEPEAIASLDAARALAPEAAAALGS